MKKIKTFEAACKALGISTDIKIDVSALSESEQKYFIANYKMLIVAKALNDGWAPNWDDRSEAKWYPRFRMSSGFGFSNSVYGNWDSVTLCGSRLCFKSEEISDYAGKQFEELYKDLFTF
jgi:hypothetical protein